jgi:hypothetical protein
VSLKDIINDYTFGNDFTRITVEINTIIFQQLLPQLGQQERNPTKTKLQNHNHINSAYGHEREREYLGGIGKGVVCMDLRRSRKRGRAAYIGLEPRRERERERESLRAAAFKSLKMIELDEKENTFRFC